MSSRRKLKRSVSFSKRKAERCFCNVVAMTTQGEVLTCTVFRLDLEPAKKIRIQR